MVKKILSLFFLGLLTTEILFSKVSNSHAKGKDKGSQVNSSFRNEEKVLDTSQSNKFSQKRESLLRNRTFFGKKSGQERISYLTFERDQSKPINIKAAKDLLKNLSVLDSISHKKSNKKNKHQNTKKNNSKIIPPQTKNPISNPPVIKPQMNTSVGTFSGIVSTSACLSFATGPLDIPLEYLVYHNIPNSSPFSKDPFLSLLTPADNGIKTFRLTLPTSDGSPGNHLELEFENAPLKYGDQFYSQASIKFSLDSLVLYETSESSRNWCHVLVYDSEHALPIIPLNDSEGSEITKHVNFCLQPRYRFSLTSIIPNEFLIANNLDAPENNIYFSVRVAMENTCTKERPDEDVLVWEGVAKKIDAQ